MTSLIKQLKQGTVYFPITFHMHQPVGNFPWVIEDAFQKAYLPLLQTIKNHSKVKINLHISGPLLIWLKKYHPNFFDLIKLLYSNNQLEIIGGGFYEPILAIIPEEDRIKQIEKTVNWWRENYNITPKGLWLAERVWVPDLPKTLAKLKIEFVFIDDYLLRMAGLSEDETFFTYTTEYQGYPITIFPINESIRYLTPWKSPSESIKYLQKARDSSHEAIVVMISDAEKMGVWPAGDRTTHDICYVNGYDGRKGWMDSFFEALIDHNWIKPVLLSTYLSNHTPKGLVYLPTSSYDKMAIWALPTTLRKRLERLRKKAQNGELSHAKDILTFTQGSIWQNFLVKYSQANVIHKRMMYCRNKLKTFESLLSTIEVQKIWENILASQSNDAYWSGMFGGIYYRFLRHTCLQHIIRADYLIDQSCKEKNITLPEVLTQDVLLDGHMDGILENENISCFISSLKGGSIFSLNLKERNYDFQNVLQRIKESYHTEDASIVEDGIEKWSFQDHFFHEISGVQIYQTNHYKDVGDFANQEYAIECDSENRIILHRKAKVRLTNNNPVSIVIRKSYKLMNSSLLITYEIRISGGIDETELYFTPEMNFLAASYPYKTFSFLNKKKYGLNELIEEKNCDLVELHDTNEYENVSLGIELPNSMQCHLFPIYSQAKSELGFEKQYQGTSIFPFFKITKEKSLFQIRITLKSLEL